MAISSARSIGCVVINIQPQLIREKKEHLVLGLIWQIIRIYIFRHINIRNVPEMVLLKAETEDESIVYKLKPEEILIRWLNYHMALDGEERRVKNLGKDVSDGVAYGHVFKHISGDFKEDYWSLTPLQKAERLMEHCKKLGINPYIKPQDIVDGSARLNILFSAQVFNSHHGLRLKEEKKPEPIPEPVETDESREIKVFKNWINSMGLEEVYVSWLIEDLKDGRILLRVLDRFRAKIVDWENKYSPKHSYYVWVANCNYFMELLKENFKQVKIVNIGGKDISDGKTTLVLGVVWQLCKLYWIERCGEIPDAELISWANSRVPQQFHIKTLKDKDISNCMFLLKLIGSINPKVVDEKMLKTCTP